MAFASADENSSGLYTPVLRAGYNGGARRSLGTEPPSHTSAWYNRTEAKLQVRVSTVYTDLLNPSTVLSGRQ